VQFASKLHCLADALGRLQCFQLTIEAVADCQVSDIPKGLFFRALAALLAYNRYSANSIRVDIVEQNIEAVIAGLLTRRVQTKYDPTLDEERTRIASMFGQLKVNVAFASRHHQLAKNVLGLVYLATPG